MAGEVFVYETRAEQSEREKEGENVVLELKSSRTSAIRCPTNPLHFPRAALLYLFFSTDLHGLHFPVKMLT